MCVLCEVALVARLTQTPEAADQISDRLLALQEKVSDKKLTMVKAQEELNAIIESMREGVDEKKLKTLRVSLKDKNQEGVKEGILKMLNASTTKKQNGLRKRESDSLDDGDTETEVKFKDVTFEHTGGKIILPEGMTTEEAMVWLQRKLEEDETVIGLSHEIPCYPIEGAWALISVLKEKYGFIDIKGGGWWESPPTFIGVDIGQGQTIQVPWGKMLIPGIEGYLEAGFRVQRDKSVCFRLNGEVKRKHENTITEIVGKLKEFVRTKSLFRGKALQIAFPDPENPFSADPGYLPKVMDVSGVREEELIFPDTIEDLVQTSLFAPIEFTQECRDLKIPLKRGVLLEGPYGTGKTLTAWVTAKKCVQNNWTFFYLKVAKDLDRAIALAKQYQPCVIFAEDLDSAVNGEERTEEINTILNTIDGIDAKGHEVMVVVTTNHVEHINKAMLRPGRLDAVIPIRAPDAAAAERLMRLYGRELLSPEEDLSEAGKLLAGHIPAFVRETVERSKLSAVRRQREKGMPLLIQGHDLVVAANGMNAQIELLKDQGEEMSDGESAMDVLGEHIVSAAEKIAVVLKNGKHPSAPAAT